LAILDKPWRPVWLARLGDLRGIGCALRKILILARKEDDLIPEVPVEMALQSVANTFGLADVDGTLPAFGVVTSQKVDAGFLRFFTSEHAIQLAPRPGDGFAVQFESSAVRRRFGSPLTKNSLIVALGMSHV
jgi:hypothetical protein